MKNIIYVLIILAFLITGCGKSHKFTLNGEISGLKNDTILVYYLSPVLKLDTIIALKGKFQYTIPADTINIFSLILNKKRDIPVFAQADKEATISGNINNLIIKGEEDNERMNEIFAMERKYKKDTLKMENWIEQYAINNPNSYANIYLINHYFIQRRNIDYQRTNRIIEKLNGNIKDIPFMIMIQSEIDNNTTKMSSILESLSIPDKNGKYPKWNILSDKVTLITFWASWDKGSKELQDSLSVWKKKFNDKKFQIISISLDIDKETWKNSLPQDTARWLQLCDLKGWDNNIVKKMQVNRLPYTIITDTKKNIVASDIYGNDMKNKIAETLNAKEEIK